MLCFGIILRHILYQKKEAMFWYNFETHNFETHIGWGFLSAFYIASIFALQVI
uniref:Uncharacterized protein n=1 Tax=Anguilla anguilla TaxID=7936 RepID=A0A0E9SAJ9_ANGAN